MRKVSRKQTTPMVAADDGDDAPKPETSTKRMTRSMKSPTVKTSPLKNVTAKDKKSHDKKESPIIEKRLTKKKVISAPKVTMKISPKLSPKVKKKLISESNESPSKRATKAVTKRTSKKTKDSPENAKSDKRSASGSATKKSPSKGNARQSKATRTTRSIKSPEISSPKPGPSFTVTKIESPPKPKTKSPKKKVVTVKAKSPATVNVKRSVKDKPKSSLKKVASRTTKTSEKNEIPSLKTHTKESPQKTRNTRSSPASTRTASSASPKRKGPSKSKASSLEQQIKLQYKEVTSSKSEDKEMDKSNTTKRKGRNVKELPAPDTSESVGGEQTQTKGVSSLKRVTRSRRGANDDSSNLEPIKEETVTQMPPKKRLAKERSLKTQPLLEEESASASRGEVKRISARKTAPKGTTKKKRLTSKDKAETPSKSEGNNALKALYDKIGLISKRLSTIPEGPEDVLDQHDHDEEEAEEEEEEESKDNVEMQEEPNSSMDVDDVGKGELSIVEEEKEEEMIDLEKTEIVSDNDQLIIIEEEKVNDDDVLIIEDEVENNEIDGHDDGDSNEKVSDKHSQQMESHVEIVNETIDLEDNDNALIVQKNLEDTRKRKSPSVERLAEPSKKLRLQLPVPQIPKFGGHVLTLGEDIAGQLGLSKSGISRKNPQFVEGIDDLIVQIACGAMHTVCLTNNGQIYTFGCNDEAALGRDTSSPDEEDDVLTSVPKKVALPVRVAKVTAGDSHTVALTDQGSVYICGTFRDTVHSGSVGIFEDAKDKSPVKHLTIIPNFETTYVDIASGSNHVLMLNEDGTVYSFGIGSNGELGRLNKEEAELSDDNRSQFFTPKIVKLDNRDIKCDKIWSSQHCSFARTITGQIYAWGLNNYSQLGFPYSGSGFEIEYFPKKVSLIPNNFNNKVEAIANGQKHTLILDSNGRVYSCGRYIYGVLGCGDETLPEDYDNDSGEVCDPRDRKNAKLIEELKDEKIISIAAAPSASFALTDSGNVYSWGMSGHQIGNPDRDLLVPTRLSGRNIEDKTILSVSAGSQHTALIVATDRENGDH